MKNLPDERTILAELVALQSVSTDPARSKYIREIVLYLKKIAEMCNMRPTIIKTPLHPIFMAVLDNGKPTTRCFYCHYDVQPEGKMEEWKSNPFILTARGEQLYGRGTADDKGHIAQLFSALVRAQKNNALNSNIVLLFEGEEEVGSINFEHAQLHLKKQLERAHVFYILDSSVSDIKTPQIVYGLRGIIEYELTITTATQELHSGLYGNVAVNSALLLSQFFASMFSKNNYLTVPHMYDHVVKLAPDEDTLLKKDDEQLKDLQRKMRLTRTVVPKGRKWYEASKTLPSLDIHGMQSGFVDGIKTIIPNTARAVFSIRLVPNQSPNDIHKALNSYAKKFFTDVTYTLAIKSAARPFLTDIDNPYVKELECVFKNHFPNPVRFTRSGGSIPAAEIVSRIYGQPVITTGFCSPDSNLHGPNEHISEELYTKGIRVLSDLLSL